MKPSTPPSAAPSHVKPPLREVGEGACPEPREGSLRTGVHREAAGSLSRASRGMRSVGSVALTRPHHVRDVAALVFNRFHRQWGSNPSGAQVRTLVAMLTLSRKLIVDLELERRLTALEDQHWARQHGGCRDPRGGAGGGPAAHTLDDASKSQRPGFSRREAQAAPVQARRTSCAPCGALPRRSIQMASTRSPHRWKRPGPQRCGTGPQPKAIPRPAQIVEPLPESSSRPPGALAPRQKNT
jgi:hypothetical protein